MADGSMIDRDSSMRTSACDQESVPAIGERLAAPEPNRWVFTGDSITHGVRHTGARRDYVQRFEEHLRWQQGRRRDAVVKTAISGWTIFDIEADLSWNVLQFRPHVLVINVGVNDAVLVTDGRVTLDGWVATYRSTLDRIAAACSPTLVLQTPTPIDLESDAADVARRRDLPRLIDPIRSLAFERGATLVDHWAAWAPHVATGRFREWMNDPLHPNARGHRMMAQTLLEAIGASPP